MILKCLKITLLLFITTVASYAQQEITLDFCYRMAFENHPLKSERELLKQQSLLTSRNIMTGWMPSIDLNATAGYNSDVPDLGSTFAAIPFPIPEMNVPKEQYRAFMEISQVLYDGGLMKQLTLIEDATAGIREQQNRIEIYAIFAMVNDLYFSILALDSQHEILLSYLDNITLKEATARSAIDNGVIAPYEADILSAEKLKIERMIDDSQLMQETAYSLLSSVIGHELSKTDNLTLPLQDIINSPVNRPELLLFDMRISQADLSDRLLKSQRLPKASAFAGFGYGNPPGNNFFADSFDPYYYFGAGLKWEIYDWESTKRKREINSINKNLLEIRKNEVTQTLERALTSKQSQISILKGAIETDLENIVLRERIAEAVTSKFENGTISSSDLIVELNALREAKLKLELDRISIVRATSEYNHILGNNNY